MGKKKNKGGQQQGQNQQGQQQQPAPQIPPKKEKKWPVIYCYESWDGNVCTITFVVVNEGKPVKDGILQIFGEEIAPLSLFKTDENGSTYHPVIVEKELIFGVMLLGTPASTWVNLFPPVNEQEVISQMSLNFRM